MNVVLQELENSEGDLRIELPAEDVEREWKNVVQAFAALAKIPGFRPGKAPRELIASRYAKEIQERLVEELSQSAVTRASAEKDIRILGFKQISRQEIAPDRTFHFHATVVLEPKFELPDYHKLVIRLPEPKVTEEEITQAMESLRQQHASYEPIEGRAAELGDFAVVTYTSFLDGQPLKTAMPDAPIWLHGKENVWVRLEENGFFPPLSQRILGMKPGENQTFPILLAADFPHAPLAGKTITVEVSLLGLNLEKLPEWNDELAGKVVAGKSLAELREMVAENLRNEKEKAFERAKADAIIKTLLENLNFPLSSEMWKDEMMTVLREVVTENMARGVTDEEIQKHKSEFLDFAKASAEMRVRSRFLLLRIAREEKLQVSDQDLLTRVVELSMAYNIPARKLLNDLKKRNAIRHLKAEILMTKAMNLLMSKAVVETIPA